MVANTTILVALVVVIGMALPFAPQPLGLIRRGRRPGAVRRHTAQLRRFARPELWVFGAVLGAEAMIVLAIAMNDGALTAAMAFCVAGRRPGRPIPEPRLRAGHSLRGGAGRRRRPAGRSRDHDRDPLALSLPLVGIAAVHTVSAVLRDSDVENRGVAILDSLTGMLNRAALVNRTTEIEHQSRLSGEPVAVLVLDLDRFKLVNDNHGHATGDAVLRGVAQRLRRELRAYDLAYRFGGEEFVVLLLGGTTMAAAATGERLRAAIAGEPILGLDITVSVGIAASAPGTAFVWDDVFPRADAALYRAKAAGRDRVAGDGSAFVDAELTGAAAS